MIKEREILEENINEIFNIIKSNKKLIDTLKNKMLNHNILPGYVQKIVRGKVSLSDLDLVILCLLTIYLYEAIEDYDKIEEFKKEQINPITYFTEKEIDKAKNYQIPMYSEDKYPIIFDNAQQLSLDDYMIVVDIKDIINLYNSNVLEYNFDTQREPKYVKDKNKNSMIMKPKINRQSVNEIKDYLLKGMLIPTVITLNVLADDRDDIQYNKSKGELIINSGEIDILDGFHRISGMLRALRENPELEQKMYLSVKNYSIKKAQQYVAQINKVNKVDKSHLQSLQEERYSDYVVKELRIESEIGDKIINVNKIQNIDGLVSFKLLSDAIEDNFKIKTKKEARELIRYLTTFFDTLINEFPEEFNDNIKETRKNKVINTNQFFWGYVVLARRIKEENLRIDDTIKNIIEKFNLPRTSGYWVEKGILSKEGYIEPYAKNKVKELFEEIELTTERRGVNV